MRSGCLLVWPRQSPRLKKQNPDADAPSIIKSDQSVPTPDGPQFKGLTMRPIQAPTWPSIIGIIITVGLRQIFGVSSASLSAGSENSKCFNSVATMTSISRTLSDKKWGEQSVELERIPRCQWSDLLTRIANRCTLAVHQLYSAHH